MALMGSVSVTCTVLYFVLFCIDFSMTYTELTIESDKVCSNLVKKRKLKLHRNEQSGIIVKETRYFDTWSGQYEFECNFLVKGDHNDGVIAVIQKLSLRKEDNESAENFDECLDFVQFRRDDGTKSVKYCGKMSAFSETSGDQDVTAEARPEEPTTMLELSQNAFYDPGGQLEVKIYIKNKHLLPFQTIDLVIAFTSYTPCYKRVRNYSSCGTDMCVWDGFFQDGVVNCPFSNCLDEGGLCRSPPAVSKRGLSSKVTVGAIATIFLAFLLFFVCLWLVRRHSLLCWSRDCAGRRRPEPRVEMRSLDDPGPPSAPPETPVEKDPPPPYESLFPDK
ncbi:uncharacterized protein LOC134532497 [Bacillus rossius redtenbacheri]|uniref:uncharacterized protein LOC134532497 n=1 Tax=Bacillus rossius redtenbacheri TaxID=93214 RepID=UPI002FDCE109